MLISNLVFEGSHSVVRFVPSHLLIYIIHNAGDEYLHNGD